MPPTDLPDDYTGITGEPDHRPEHTASSWQGCLQLLVLTVLFLGTILGVVYLVTRNPGC